MDIVCTRLDESTYNNGITVGELKRFLDTIPDDAYVSLNHPCRISNPEDDGSESVGWVFDNFYEMGYVEKKYFDDPTLHKTMYFNFK